MRWILVFLLSGCAVDNIESGLRQCDSDDGSYIEPTGRWTHSLDGVDTGSWILGVSWTPDSEGSADGIFETYGCVIEQVGGPAPGPFAPETDQTHEWSGRFSLASRDSAQPLVPGDVDADPGRFEAELNRNLDRDLDGFSIDSGSSGEATIEFFDPAAGRIVGSLLATADLADDVESEDAAVELSIDFDMSWEP